MIELDELGGPIPGWEAVPASGSAVEAAAAAIATVERAKSHNPTDGQDRHAIDTIAGAAALPIDS